MSDILQDFFIQVSPQRAFEGVTVPAHLDQWWTMRSQGRPSVGTNYELDFGPEYLWIAEVTRAEPAQAFELRFTQADSDWLGTTVGFEFAPSKAGTQICFYHRGWPEANQHFRVSAHCWALYLRILRRFLEHGEVVPYSQRLSA